MEPIVTVAEPHKLSAGEAAALIRAGKLTAVALLEACLARVEEREPMIGAWQHLDPDVLLMQAAESDAKEPSGLLHGVPIGIKDICVTKDMPTFFGSRARLGNCMGRDAACVALARRAGAIIMGKTTTTEFAGPYPGKTRNPHDTTRTPGGSSSGSAAAVADYMVPIAIGTQTGGSLIRPASFCGVYAYKPSFGLFSLDGVRPAAAAFDTLGCMARSMDDLELTRDVLLGGSIVTITPPVRPTAIGYCKTFRWSEASPQARSALEEAVLKVSKRGVKIVEVDLPDPFEKLYELNNEICAFEYTVNATAEWNDAPKALSPKMRAMKSRSSGLSVAELLGYHSLLDELRARSVQLFEGVDAILSLSADDVAPIGIASTGTTTFTAIWQSLGLPSFSIPALTGENGLPIGIQVIGRRYADLQLAATARYIDQTLIHIARRPC